MKIFRTFIFGALLALSVIPIASFALSQEDSKKGDKGPPALDMLLFSPADASAVNVSTGNLWYGTGNPNSGFLVERNDGVEIALKVKFRTGNDIYPLGIAKDGTTIIKVPTGPQIVDASRGVSVAAANRAAWSFDYVITTGLDGSTKGLSSYSAELQIDTDSGASDKLTTLSMVALPGTPVAGRSGFGWKDGSGNIRIGDDGGTTKTTQNSQNVAFYPEIDGNPSVSGVQPYTFGPARLKINLTVRESGKKGKVIAQIATEVVVMD